MQIFGPRIHQGFLLRENRPHQTIPNHRMTQDETKSNTNIKNDSSNNGNTTTTPWVGQIGGLPLYIYIYTAAGAAPTKTRRHQEVIEVKIYPKLVSGQHVGTRPSRGCS